jgi:hypothetical protein
MTPVRRSLQVIAGVLLMGTLLGAGNRERTQCPAASTHTTTWRRASGSAFTLRLPRGYRRLELHGIDSAVEGWSAPGGRKVSADYGPTEYVGIGIRDDSALLCEGVPNGPRRIVLYHDRGIYGVGYYGRDPHDNRSSLVFTAESPREADIPELLAIARSIRWTERTPTPAPPR